MPVDDDKLPIPMWMRVFLQVGFPTGVAILLLAALLGWMPSPIMKKLDSMEYSAWQQSAILRAICYRFSETQKDRLQCEPWKGETP
jgi:hypothetical protein